MVSAQCGVSMFMSKLPHVRPVQSSVFGSMRFDKVPFVFKTVDPMPILMHGTVSLLGQWLNSFNTVTTQRLSVIDFTVKTSARCFLGSFSLSEHT